MAEEFNINNLLQNKMFLQMLSAAGTDISQGTGGTNTNAAVQGNIQNQNFMKLLKMLLSTDGTKGTFSNTGVNLTIPKETEMFKSLLSEDLATPSTNLTSVPQNANAGGMYGSGMGGVNIANPFVEGQPNTEELSASDLAGLTTKDISTAFGLKQSQDELRGKTVAQIQDALYKSKLMENINSDIETRTPRFEIPGLGKVNATQYLNWKKLQEEKKPNEAKLYEYAMKQGFTGSFMDFENRAQTTHKKDYDEAIKGGYKGDFNSWMLDMAKAGAINLGDKLEQKKKEGELKGQLYFNNPEWTKDVDKVVQTFDKDQAWLLPETDRPLARAKVKVKAIEDRIAAGGGNVQNVVLAEDGKTMVWTVKWPSGDVGTVRQAVK